jgi:two-component system OmpR family response regulator
MKNSTNTPSVFLVDDDTMFLTALNHKLAEKFKATIRIRTFANGEECLQQMEEKPDIVVLDYYLNTENPGKTLNGIEVLQKIKTVSGATEVVMLSGEDKLQVKEDSLRLGAYQYLNKNATSAHILQNTIKDIIHEIIIKRSSKENQQLNYIMAGIIVMVVGLITYLFLRFF